MEGLPGKRIVQSTFDDMVKENIEDLELDPETAIADAIEELKAQGIELNNIVTDMVITDDGTSWHPVINLTEQLKTIAPCDKDVLHTCLAKLQVECDKSLGHRVLSSKHASGYLTLNDCYNRLEPQNIESKVCVLKTYCSFLNGQPDLVAVGAMEMYLEICEDENVELSILGTRLIKLSCIMHETNRQTFVSMNLIMKVADVIRRHQANKALVKEACQLYKTLTLDDDPRVPFGKAHDHAKMIVMEAEALELLLEIATTHDDDKVLAEIFSTLGKLAVRNEFCQRIVDLGGLELMLRVLHKNVENKAIVTNIVGVFKAIAGNDNVKVAVTKSEAPSIIVEAMDHHQSSEALCANSCACLATISLRNPHNVKRIMECHGHSAVIQCMKVHPKSIQVQKQACMALRNLVSRSRDHCDSILALGAEELINRAMGVQDCHDEAKAALRDLGCKVELISRWKGEKGQIKQDHEYSQEMI